MEKNSFWLVIGHLKELIPIIALVIGLIVGWINIKNELRNMTDKQLLLEAKIVALESKQDKFTDLLSRINENLATLNVSFEFIKERIK